MLYTVLTFLSMYRDAQECIHYQFYHQYDHFVHTLTYDVEMDDTKIKTETEI